tara:strand:- start:258 stop:422 length:165 start_codon:yes stop_codon:yes gene_type:complete
MKKLLGIIVLGLLLSGCGNHWNPDNSDGLGWSGQGAIWFIIIVALIIFFFGRKG